MTGLPPSPPPAGPGASDAALARGPVDPVDDGAVFPIAAYDELWAAEILPLLPELDDDELALVLRHEEAGAARSSIVNRVEVLLGRDATPGFDRDGEG